MYKCTFVTIQIHSSKQAISPIDPNYSRDC